MPDKDNIIMNYCWALKLYILFYDVRISFRYSSKDDVVHWEQFGRLDADIEIDRIGIEIRNAATVRDRSFGIFNFYN